MTNPDDKITISRTMVGVLTIGCFVLAGVVKMVWPSDAMWFAGFIRVGLVMGALWLALPTKTRPAAWANVSPATFVGLLVGAVLLPRYPRVVVVSGIILLALNFVLKPRGSRGRRPS